MTPATKSMQIGVVSPLYELRGDPSAVGRIGRAVEDLGFDHLLAYDHVLGAFFVSSNVTPLRRKRSRGWTLGSSSR
jgi:hypothetical protein